MPKYLFLNKIDFLFLLVTPTLLLATPNNPSNLTLIPSHDSVTLSWQDNSNDERGFKIYRDGVKIHTALANVTSYHDKALTPNTHYTYMVKATDDYLWYQPDTDTSWQWQLSETINQNYDVDLYNIDLFDTDVATIQNLHDSGKKVICYFSAGTYEDWREDADDFSAAVLGDNLDGWEGEKWLDVRSDALRPIMISRLELAKQKGCDGVEPDNVDGFTNATGFDLTAEDQLAYNLFLSEQAHNRGLSIGLKNDLDQIEALAPFFDFAVNEQCHFYKECNRVYPFIYANKPVFNAEYESVYVNNTDGARDTMCADSSVIGFKTLVLPNMLDDSFRYACQEVASQSQLLFSSGFEEGVYLGDIEGDTDSAYQEILGSDNQPYSWPIDILGASESALHYVDYDNNQALFNEIQTVTGHDGNDTKALYNVQYYNTNVTQSPYEILNITEGKKDLYIKYWIKLDSASLTQPDMWRTFFEYKTKGYATDEGYRLISYIYTDDDGVPFWHWQGDKSPSDSEWEIENRRIPVPMNEWFLTEFYWHWSEGEDGRSLWKVNGKVVGYNHGPTTRNSKVIDFIMLTQIYGNANPKHQWIDDIEIWDGLPPR